MMLRIGEAHEQAPPVVDQRHTARQQPAAFEIMRGEAAPAPLVLQLVRAVDLIDRHKREGIPAGEVVHRRTSASRVAWGLMKLDEPACAYFNFASLPVS